MSNNVISYSLDPDRSTGLEFRMQFMPRFFIDKGQGPYECHMHNYYQIIWFRHGHGYHVVDYNRYPVSDNMLFFLAPGQLHSFDGANDYEGFIIQFNESFMADEETSESIFLKYNVFNAYGSSPYYKVTEEEAERLLVLVNEMNREYSLRNAFAHKDYMQYLIRMFLIRVMRSGERAEPEKLYVTSTANLYFVRFRQLVEQHFRQVHTVKEYAQMLNVSTRSLTEYVKQSVHRTPLELINERICLEAKRQIQYSTLRINQISDNLGFSDSSYFVKFFKRHTHCKPTDFRS
jgi:AraC-like DNA-binding protein